MDQKESLTEENTEYMNITTEGHDGARDVTIRAASRDKMPEAEGDESHLSRGQRRQKVAKPEFTLFCPTPHEE